MCHVSRFEALMIEMAIDPFQRALYTHTIRLSIISTNQSWSNLDTSTIKILLK